MSNDTNAILNAVKSYSRQVLTNAGAANGVGNRARQQQSERDKLRSNRSRQKQTDRRQEW